MFNLSYPKELEFRRRSMNVRTAQGHLETAPLISVKENKVERWQAKLKLQKKETRT